MTLSLLAPAKLNLFLHIVGQRDDGYHNLQTVFQILDYGDTLDFAVNNSGEISITPDLPDVPKESNLIYRAARLLQEKTECTLGADINIHKVLPMGGGLGGGSSDAATTLVALNYLWETNLDTTSLMQLGVKLGADVPVFIQGHSAWAEGIGEQLQPIDLPENWFLVIKPDCEVATADIFSRKELTRDSAAITVAAFLEQGGHNDCEPVVRNHYPAVDNALIWLKKHASARLTGTGACIFASFPNQEQAAAIQSLVPSPWQSFIARGVNQSPVVPFLKN